MPTDTLYRFILSDAKIDALLPKSACEVSFVGNGDTSFSMREMKKVIDRYGYQVEALAQYLKQGTLEDTLQNIQWFAYNFFQYKQDLSDQLLRSPACSYAQRFEGIDCKSYSILVACLLNELNINNYLRKVAYNDDKGFSHVYNIIPKNKKTDSTRQVYIIDGTLDLKINQEPNYLYKQDLKMEGLPHYSLARPRSARHYKTKGRLNQPMTSYEYKFLSQRGELNGYGAIVAGVIKGGSWLIKNRGKIADFFKKLKKINLKNIKMLVGCLGKKAYPDNKLDENIQRIGLILTEKFHGLQEVLDTKDYARFSRQSREVILFFEALKKGYELRLSEGWKNTCTENNFKATISYLQKNIGAITNGFKMYLDTYFDKTPDSQAVEVHLHNFENNDLGYFLHHSNFTGHGGVQMNDEGIRYVFTPKKGMTIPFYEPNDTMLKAIENGSDRGAIVQQFVKEMVDTATTFIEAEENPATPNNQFIKGGSSTSPKSANVDFLIPNRNNTVAPKQAGGGIVMGAVVLAAIAYYLSKK